MDKNTWNEEEKRLIALAGNARTDEVEQYLGEEEKRLKALVGDARADELEQYLGDETNNTETASWRKNLSPEEQKLVAIWDGRVAATIKKMHEIIGGKEALVANEIRKAGYTPTEGMVNDFCKLNEISGKFHTMREVCTKHRRQEFQSPEEEEAVNSIAKRCQRQQEMQNLPDIIE